jgi:hypothetical protein
MQNIQQQSCYTHQIDAQKLEVAADVVMVLVENLVDFDPRMRGPLSTLGMRYFPKPKLQAQ